MRTHPIFGRWIRFSETFTVPAPLSAWYEHLPLRFLRTGNYVLSFFPIACERVSEVVDQRS